jgi:hypothetical protein
VPTARGLEETGGELRKSQTEPLSGTAMSDLKTAMIESELGETNETAATLQTNPQRTG